MTLGQRIQELRKQRGMSQEALGSALGVSRQAVSKWEGDNGIPELDTLIAMSRLFDVTLGALLGVETPSEQTAPNDVLPDSSAAEDSADRVEAVLRRYVEQTTDKEERSWFARWGWVISAAIILATAFIVMFSRLNSLRSTVMLLQHDLSHLQVQISNNQSSLSEQIRSTIYDVLAEEANLLSTFQWEIVDFDLEHETATLRLDATMKEYTAGSKLQFCAEWQKTDDTEGQTTAGWVDGPNFQAQLTLPLNFHTEICIRVKDAEGNIREQTVQTPIYELHPDNFRLYARNLITPFAIKIKGFGITTETAKAEQAYIIIESIFPEFIWPEKAKLTAYVNGIEVLREIMTIEPADVPTVKENQVFNASIQDTYCDLSLKDGDVLEIELVVTDNLGRTETFSDCVSVQDGELQRQPLEAPLAQVYGGA